MRSRLPLDTICVVEFRGIVSNQKFFADIGHNEPFVTLAALPSQNVFLKNRESIVVLR